jgi:hypothetical protein
MREQKRILGMPEFTMREQHWIFDVPETKIASSKSHPTAPATMARPPGATASALQRTCTRRKAEVRAFLPDCRDAIAEQFDGPFGRSKHGDHRSGGPMRSIGYSQVQIANLFFIHSIHLAHSCDTVQSLRLNEVSNAKTKERFRGHITPFSGKENFGVRLATRNHRYNVFSLIL